MKTRTALRTGLIAGLMAATASVNANELSVVGSWSGLELHRVFENPYWSEVLPEASGGGLTVSLTTHDQMGLDGADVYNMLSEGLYDVGMTVMNYAVQDAPEMEALDLPMISLDVETARSLTEAYMPIADIGMERRYDAKVLAIVPYPQQIVFCRDSVDGLEDLAGRNIRASGRTTAEFLDGVGANSLNIDFGEVPGALSRGVIDCAVTGSMSGYSSAWYEMASYLYTLPAGGWDYVVTAIRNDTWNNLSAEQQDILQSTIQTEFTDKVWANAVVDTQRGVACLTGQGGECNAGDAQNMVLVEPSEADLERSMEILQEIVLPNWARRVDQDIVDMWNDAIGSQLDLTASR
ncbi:MAG: TRAP transporter substrate-binding protein [Natronospirillum sp.]|uniref:TRAP transporter substrate-binding protein n=1 Tax=Natronospirillum sp. TaxID=2812955 RepID=UPI0025EA770F|nr:TRAP transporter substrate-binding protein [Natronospirillum sp.]MCH8550736.1 TRAP transporter substrate-binding protein [Natronospirillum sp.]